MMNACKKILLKCHPLMIIIYFFYRVFRGYLFYCILYLSNGKKCMFYSTFLNHTGDNFLAASVYKDLSNMNGDKNSKLLIIGNSGRQICKLFDLEDYIIVNKKQSDMLVCFYKFLNTTIATNIYVMHYHPAFWYYGIIENLLFLHKINFFLMLEINAFNGIHFDLKRINNNLPQDNKVNIINRKIVLKDKKIAVISPYANCMELLPKEFWEELVGFLKNKGYVIYTNCSGGNEKVISKTNKLFLSYADMISFLNQVDVFIALRSGLVDVTLFAKCRRIILYPCKNSHKWGIGSTKDVFSIKDYCDDSFLLELEVDSENYKDFLMIIYNSL